MGAEFWTEDRIKQLRVLRDEGLSFGVIAERIGISRAAVIGKASRLKLKPRKPDVTVERRRSTVERKKRAAPAASPVAATPSLQKVPRGNKQASPDADGIRLLRSRAWQPLDGVAPVPLLERTGCCWPVEGPAGETLFCNAARDGHPIYCPSHHAIMVQPAERRAA